MTLQLNPLFVPFIPAEVSSASGVVYSPFGQTAPSARSRSSEGSSDDQVPVPTHDGFIEVDLRAGGPQLCEQPCQTLRPIPRTHEYYQALDGHNGYLLIGELMNICNQEGLNYSAIDFCGRRSVYTPERDPIVTLLIRANRPDVTQRGWANIARKLQYHLRGQGLPGISVEIMDPRLEEDAKIHSCHPNDAVVPVWADIVYDILARVNDTTGINTIGCFRIGRDMDRLRCPPTVLVGVDRQVFRDWKVVREAIVSALNSRGLESVGVRIRKDKKPLRANNVERNPIQPSDCRPDPPLGYSLGPHNMKDAIGTLGGWVELKSPRTGQWVSFAITCTHCCLPPRGALNDADQDILWKWKQEGVRFGDPDAARLLSVDAPCYRDIKAGIDAKESLIDVTKADHAYRRVEEARAQSSFVFPSDEASWRTVSRILEDLYKERNTMESFVQTGQLVLGNVFAASGLREVPSTSDPSKLSVRDWALIQPKSGRSAGDNDIRTLSGFRHKHHLGEFKTALPPKDEKVYKIGRVSGFTSGQFGALQSCSLENETKNGHTVSRRTWEYVVTQPSGAFLELGDSGSLLFDANGDVLGMLFGASEKGDISYFTATADLLQDIKSITGALEVRLKQA